MKKLAWPRRQGRRRWDTALVAEALESAKELHRTLCVELKNISITFSLLYKLTGFSIFADPMYKSIELVNVERWLVQRRKLYSQIDSNAYSLADAYEYRQLRFMLERIQSNDELLQTFRFMKHCHF